MTVRQAIREAIRHLEVQSATARLDAEVLLGSVLERNRAWLRAHEDDTLLEVDCTRYFALVARRQLGEPVAYLLGCQEFWSLPLRVARHTLIPRPETELLVELALGLVSAETAQALDLGTGTGAVALALKSERPSWAVTAVDRLPEAVTLAEDNAKRLGLSVECLCSNWFAALDQRRFDLIVSNPPYIDPLDPHLQGDGVKFEPLSALVAEANGLADIERIVAAAPRHLVSGGWLAVEHGFQQGEPVAKLFRRAGFRDVQTRCDLAGQARVTFGNWISMET